MIVRFFADQAFSIIGWIISVSTGSLRLPSTMVDGAVWLLEYFFSDAAYLFFFFVRPETFWVCMDFLFLYWAYKPVKTIMQWTLKKIPFVGIH